MLMLFIKLFFSVRDLSAQTLDWQPTVAFFLSFLGKTMMTISGLKIRRRLDWHGKNNKKVNAPKKKKNAD